ncbi:MAG: T9SS C-terminal target domain-containing protein [Calditrichaeota bacterium]|nr:T9SS type A sorting domain-containing protein [Calditrichota bacterium]RQW06612.1 MAG: T9SS C-terminal target domain-containing protein [Calditrichota bacterium]
MIKKIGSVLLVFFFLSPVFSQEVKYGNLSLLISQIKSAMPGENSNAFVIPTSGEMESFRSVTRHMLNARYASADSLADSLGYELYEWYDTAYDSSLYYVLMEPSANVSGGVQLGWGTYIFYPTGGVEVAIEVPHPLFDSNTWQVGFTSYQVVQSRYFLMAGTHRYANGRDPRPADVAHNTQNMFHVVHQEISPLVSHTMQIHGFSRNNHPAGYPDVILSNGTPSPGPILDSLAQGIIGEGYSVGIFDGVNYTTLGATTNTQGQFSNSNGYSFIHMEIEYFIRANAAHWEKFVDVIYATFYVPMSLPWLAHNEIPHKPFLYPGYPNPFNSRIGIQWYQPSSGDVTLEIFNVLGERVRILLQGYFTTGMQKVNWDGLSDAGLSVASGQYLVVLRTENSVQVKRIVLIR